MRNSTRILIAVILDVALASSAAAQTARADIDAAMTRTFGYDPGVSWNILDVRPSRISGLTEVLATVNGHPTKLYVSADGRNAVVGELIPFGTDPFAPDRAELRGAEGPARNSGPTELVIFSDFDCAHCKAAEPVLDRLAEDFPEVRQIFVQFPQPANLHPWAREAALWADCVGRTDGKAFWSFADGVFSEQDKIGNETVDATLRRLAEQAGLNGSALERCVASQETDSHARASHALGVQLDVTQVPTIFLNGRRVTNITVIPYDSLKRLVRFEIDHAGH